MQPANFLPFVVLAVLHLSSAGTVAPRQESCDFNGFASEYNTVIPLILSNEPCL